MGADETIARLAGRQDGVVTRRHLRAADISDDEIKHRLAAGRLIALHRGVYAVGHAAISDAGRIRAGLYAAGPRAAASHGSAAYLHRLISYLPLPVEITIAAGNRRRRPDLIVHRAPIETTRVRGLPVTTARRTLADLGWREELVREALVKRLIQPHEVPDKREVAPTQSVLEQWLLRLCRRADLPRPICQQRIGRYRVDFAWPAHRVIVETDGFETHGGRRRPFEDGRARDAYLIALGYVVIHFTWLQVKYEPYVVTSRLAAALALRDASTPVAP